MVDADSAVDVAAFEAWTWHEPPKIADASPFADNSLLRKRVREAVASELSKRGYRRVDGEDADFAVTFHVLITSKREAWGSTGWGWPSWSYGGDYRESTFQEGTLVLDLTSPDGRQLFWRGWVSGAVPTPDSDRDRVAEAVKRILSELPARETAPVARPADSEAD